MTSRYLSLSLVLALALLVACPFLGGESLSLTELGRLDSVAHRILFDLRLPRLLLALTVGGSLACLGGTYQILFHNPLAEPYILGISSAVTLGAASSEILFHFAPYGWGSASVGFAAAFVATLLLVALASRGGAAHLDRLVLFGMGMNFVLSSSLMLLLSYHFQQLGGGSMRWIFGQVPWVSPREAGLFLLASLPFLAILFLFARKLDALSLGDGVARTLGIDPERARRGFLFWTSAYLSLLVCYTGAIGFVGLVVPHAVRLIFRPATARGLFAHSLVWGGLFLALSDGLSRAILPPLEFPIGVITTLVGGPIFLGLLWKQRS